MRRTYRRFLVSGALALVGIAGTIVVQGGWQAVAAALAIFAGLGFVLAFIHLRSASERPRGGYPDWARGETAPAAVEAHPSDVRGVRGRSAARSMTPRHA